MTNNPYLHQNRDLFKKRPELLELVKVFRYEVQQAQRPASEWIIDDTDLQKLLKVSKRTTANYWAQGLITYAHLGGRWFTSIAMCWLPLSATRYRPTMNSCVSVDKPSKRISNPIT